MLLASTNARAQSLDQPFAQGFELNPIEPSPAGDRFFLVPGGFSDPGRPKGKPPIAAKVLLHYSLAPSLIRTDNMTGEVGEIVQHQLYAHASFTGYITPWLMMNADMPFALYQTGEGEAAPGSAVGDLRLGARFGIFGKRPDAFALSPGFNLWMPTGSPENLTGDEGVRAEPYVSVGGQASLFVYSAKFGVQFRPADYTGSTEVGPSLTFGGAAGLSLFDNVLQVGPEMSGRTLLSSEANQALSGQVSPITGAIGAKVQIGDFNVGSAFGVGFTDSPGTAPRVFLSLEYNPVASAKKKPASEKQDEPKDDEVTPEPSETKAPPPPMVDSDGDNIPDAEDACPELMGDESDNPSHHGCPYEPPKAAPTEAPKAAPVVVPLSPDTDSDGDGIRDTLDSCPRTRGIPQPENDARNGCPEGTAKPEPTPAPAAAAASATPAAAAAKAPPEPPTATWVGFRMLSPTSALIYVNLTEAVPVTSKVEDKRITFTLSGTRVRIKNNQNPLLAEHFGSVVENARLIPKGKDVELVIDLEKPAIPSSRIVKETQGATLRVELQQK